jgi:hypothetical protein
MTAYSTDFSSFQAAQGARLLRVGEDHEAGRQRGQGEPDQLRYELMTIQEGCRQCCESGPLGSAFFIPDPDPTSFCWILIRIGIILPDPDRHRFAGSGSVSISTKNFAMYQKI